MDHSRELLAALVHHFNVQRIALSYVMRNREEVEEEEEESQRVIRRRRRRKRRRRRYSVHPLWRSRDAEGEFTLFQQMSADSEEKFYEYFRMTRSCFAALLSKIKDQLTKQTTHWKRPIPPEERLAVCLRYLATGNSLQSLSNSFRLGHSTVHVIVHDTCRVITRTLLNETMPLPSKEKWEEIKDKFWEQCKFPNCLGAIEAKHVQIQKLSNKESLHQNSEKTFSVVLMALVDANCNFIAVEVGTYENGDSGIFAESDLGQSMCNGSLQMLPDAYLPGTTTSVPCVIVGDEAFPLRRNLMRPYPGIKTEGHANRTNFNKRLSIARRVVENAFEILAQKFHLYNGRIQAQSENANYIIVTTCILHNFIRAHERLSAVVPIDKAQETEGAPAWWPIRRSRGGNATNESFAVRQTFTDFLFEHRNDQTTDAS